MGKFFDLIINPRHPCVLPTTCREKSLYLSSFNFAFLVLLHDKRWLKKHIWNCSSNQETFCYCISNQLSRSLTMNLTFIFHFSFYFILFCFSFIFLFLEQLRLGVISHAVTSVTNWWCSHRTDHGTWKKEVEGSRTKWHHTVWTTHAGLMSYSWSFRVRCTVASMDHG